MQFKDGVYTYNIHPVCGPLKTPQKQELLHNGLHCASASQAGLASLISGLDRIKGSATSNVSSNIAAYDCTVIIIAFVT